MCATQFELWQRAGECERALETTTDLRERQLLAFLESLWIELANEGPFLTDDELDQEMETVRQMQVDMLGDTKLPALGRAEPRRWHKVPSSLDVH